MKTTTIINGKKTELNVGYRMRGADEFFGSWDALMRFWTPYYDSEEDLLRRAAVEIVCETKGGLPLDSKRVLRPLTATEKKEFAVATAKKAYGLCTIETV